MADNYEADPGTGGKVFASDDVVGGPTGNADWPYAKVVHGAHGATPVPVADTPAAALPVKLRNDAASVVAGQVSVGVIATAFGNVVARRFTLKASQINVDTVVIGPATVALGTGFILHPGDSVKLELTNLNVMEHISGTAAQVLSYIGEV